MRIITPKTWLRFATLMAGLLVLKVTVAIVLNYRDYLPPNFGADFLRGRERYFWDGYHWAFYTHIASGPFALLFGLLLVSEKFRLRFPKWHRYLGRVQVACVLLLLTPSGLWMAFYAAAGLIATIGFIILSLATATCIALGWRSAVKRQFAVHRRWMWRTFLLLCSAVVLRIIGGLGTVAGIHSPWFDPLASWTSWLFPLIVYELIGLRNRRTSAGLVQRVVTSRGQ